VEVGGPVAVREAVGFRAVQRVVGEDKGKSLVRIRYFAMR